MKKIKFLLIISSLFLIASCDAPQTSDVDSGTNPSSSEPFEPSEPSEVKYYTITWKNYDGAVLEIDINVKENTTPTYDGATPTKPDDTNYTYAWNGWTPSVVPATKDATYTATFKSTPKGGSNPKKVTVASHTLSDTNPPFDSFTEGQQVSETTWNSFMNGSASKFNNHYNFTYTSFYAANNYQQRFFTKNGYAVKSLQGNTYSRMYYERKSGSTFYEYIDVSDGWLRQETNSFNLTNTFTSLILDEIKVHMFAFSNYTWNEYFEQYIYDGGTFTSAVQFKNGYLASLTYIVDGKRFSIDYMFDTEIEIPDSYYYS